MSEHPNKKTLVLGASTNPDRYSFICITDLVFYGYPVVAVGLRGGEVAGIPIQKGTPAFEEVHTVTLYHQLRPKFSSIAKHFPTVDAYPSTGYYSETL